MSTDSPTLADLGVDPELGDPGTDWHPAKAEAYDADGLLLDLDEAEVAEHLAKPEAATQVDAGASLSAEDSAETPEGAL